MFTYLFWRLAFERAFKTFAQTLVALFSAGGIGLFNAPWLTAVSAAGMAALLCVLTSMASEAWGARGTPSLLPPMAVAALPVLAVAQAVPVTAQPTPAAAQSESATTQPAPTTSVPA